MTIDEAIIFERKESKKYMPISASYHNQLAKWLEELKELRVLIKSYENAPSDAYWYNKGRADAIDECIKIMLDCSCVNGCTNTDCTKCMTNTMEKLKEQK